MHLGYGYNPVADEAKAAFGARAIYNGRSFEFVPDRIDWAGDDENIKIIRELMTDDFWDHLTNLAKNRHFGDGGSEELRTGEYGGLKYIATPRSSYGYLYMTVWV